MKSENPLIKVTHYGTVHFGADVECEAVVLADGRRGFNRRQLVETVGFNKNVSGSRFSHFLAEIGNFSKTPGSLTTRPGNLRAGG